MENNDDLIQEEEFSLDDILSEFGGLSDEPAESVPGEFLEGFDDQPVTVPEAPAPEPAAAPETAEPAEAPQDDGDDLSDTKVLPEIPASGETQDTAAAEESSVSMEDTHRLEDLSQLQANAPEAAAAEADAPAESAAPAEEAEAPKPAETKPPIPFNHRTKLLEMKKKLVAGPEKRYYDLSEIGVGKLQLAIFLNLLIVMLCIAATTLDYLGMVPERRLKLLIFSQVLALLGSGVLGCYVMLDSITALFRGKFSLNTLLTVTFVACCADAVFCLKELRIPCCAAFSLVMTFALWGDYHRRSTEMAQMDTLRKAVQLNSIVKAPNFFNGKPGILRGEGDVDDFMDTYKKSGAPEKLQGVYAFIALILCLGIATVAGLRHTPAMAVQVLANSLLAAAPATFFITLTRPAALLQQRLHMVGSVLCGWKGTRKLCGKAVYPLRDQDLFPTGSIKVNGVKYYGDRSPEEVISYTTSLIAASGGGLVPVMRKLLSERAGTERKVTSFRDYGKCGIGGEIEGEPVLIGTLPFLQDMGVDIPSGTMVNQAIYTAIDGQLAAVIAISYAKMRSASAGMVSLFGCRSLIPVLLSNNFMLDSEFLRGKFSVRTRRLVFPERQVRQELSAIEADPEADVLALSTRDDLISAVYAVSGASALRKASLLGMFIHLLGGILGMLIILALAYLGSTELLTPIHVMLYHLVWMIPGLLVTEWTRTV